MRHEFMNRFYQFESPYVEYNFKSYRIQSFGWFVSGLGEGCRRGVNKKGVIHYYWNNGTCHSVFCSCFFLSLSWTLLMAITIYWECCQWINKYSIATHWPCMLPQLSLADICVLCIMLHRTRLELGTDLLFKLCFGTKISFFVPISCRHI